MTCAFPHCAKPESHEWHRHSGYGNCLPGHMEILACHRFVAAETDRIAQANNRVIWDWLHDFETRIDALEAKLAEVEKRIARWYGEPEPVQPPSEKHPCLCSSADCHGSGLCPAVAEFCFFCSVRKHRPPPSEKQERCWRCGRTEAESTNRIYATCAECFYRSCYPATLDATAPHAESINGRSGVDIDTRFSDVRATPIPAGKPTTTSGVKDGAGETPASSHSTQRDDGPGDSIREINGPYNIVPQPQAAPKCGLVFTRDGIPETCDSVKGHGGDHFDSTFPSYIPPVAPDSPPTFEGLLDQFATEPEWNEPHRMSHMRAIEFCRRAFEAGLAQAKADRETIERVEKVITAGKYLCRFDQKWDGHSWLGRRVSLHRWFEELANALRGGEADGKKGKA